jgi:hypothetical protein
MADNEHSNVSTELLRKRLQAVTKEAETLKSGGGGGTSGDMDQERLSRLEGSFEGLRSNQTLLMSAVGLVSALLIGLASYTVIQVSAVNNRLSELPGKISSDLRDLSGVISQAVTASKQTPPQVILMPTPSQQPTVPQLQTPQ